MARRSIVEDSRLVLGLVWDVSRARRVRNAAGVGVTAVSKVTVRNSMQISYRVLQNWGMLRLSYVYRSYHRLPQNAVIMGREIFF